MDLTQKLNGVVLTKAFNVKADETSDESIRINLTVDFSDATIQGVLEKAMSPEVIKAQAKVRKAFTSYKSGDSIRIKFNAPVSRAMSFEELKAKVMGAKTQEEKDYYRKQVEELRDALGN